METSKKLRITKSHIICYVLSRYCEPRTREDVMREVEALEGKDPATFTFSTNNCYWSPTGRASGGRSSVLVKGLVKKDGRMGRRVTYALTPAGHSHALEYIAAHA